MSSKVNYDNGAFSFFAGTLLVVFIVPATIYAARRVLTYSPVVKATRKARSAAEQAKLNAIAAAELAKREKLWTPTFIALLVAVGISALLLVGIVAFAGGESIAQYDPYAILGVTAGASEKDVKSAYRSLSRTHHPDRGGDAELFQKIAKAYEALTDPVARENYEKFGNPDGRQALEVSIGLPSWIVEGAGKWLLLSAYLGVLVAVVPYFMWRMYASSRKAGVGGVDPASFEWLKYAVTPDIPARGMPLLIAGLRESAAPHVPMEEADAREVQALAEALVADGRLLKFGTPAQTAIPPQLLQRNIILLHAHVCREPIASPRLRAVLATMLEHAEAALALTLEICVARTLAHPSQKIPSHQEAAMAAVEFSQMLAQCIWIGSPSLSLVMPVEAARAVARLPKRGGGVTGLLGWLKLPEADRRGLDALTPEARTELPGVLAALPCLTVEASAAVFDEEYIAAGDVVTLTVTLRHDNMPGVPDATPAPPVYAPLLEGERSEQWLLFLLDSKEKLVTTRVLRDVTAVTTERILFQAPERTGTHGYKLLVKAPAYAGLDQEVEFSIAVRPKSEVPREEEHEDDAALDGARDTTLENMMGSGNFDESDESEGEAEAPAPAVSRAAKAQAQARPHATTVRAAAAAAPATVGDGAADADDAAPVADGGAAARAPAPPRAPVVDDDEFFGSIVQGKRGGGKGGKKSQH